MQIPLAIYSQWHLGIKKNAEESCKILLQISVKFNKEISTQTMHTFFSFFSTIQFWVLQILRKSS